MSVVINVVWLFMYLLNYLFYIHLSTYLLLLLFINLRTRIQIIVIILLLLLLLFIIIINNIVVAVVVVIIDYLFIY